MKRFICTCSLTVSSSANCRWIDIDDKGRIEGETPIEDFGMFLILDEEISTHSAGRIFIALLSISEGEEPEIKEDITEDDRLSRPLYFPCLVTPEDLRIINQLLSR